MAYSVLGLRIGGTKQRRSGFTPLINIGLLAGNEGENMDRLTLVAEKPTLVIKHTPEYIVYSLIDSRVKSFDADAPGVLSIALTIPADMKLAGGKSPYNLLRETYDTFRSLYMEPVSDGRDSFKDLEYDKNIFQQIVDKYPLEKRSGKYITMNPNGISGVLKVNEGDLPDLFANSQYPEFAQFKEIEVGSKCDDKVSPDLKNIQIPMPPVKYYVYVNGNKTGDYLQYPSDTATASLPDSEDFSYPSVSFSLEELLKAPGHALIKDGASVRLLLGDEKILCELKGKNKALVIHLDKNTVKKDFWDIIMQGLNSGQLKIVSGSENITNACLSNGKVLPSNLKKLFPEFSPNSMTVDGTKYKLTIQKIDNPSSREIIIAPVVTKVGELTPSVTFGNDEGGSSRSETSTSGSSSDVQKTKKVDTDKDKSDKTKKEENKKKKGWLLWLLVVIGAGLLAVLIWLFVKMNRVDPPTLEEETKAEIEALQELEKDTIPSENPEAVLPGAEVPQGDESNPAQQPAGKETPQPQTVQPQPAVANPVVAPAPEPEPAITNPTEALWKVLGNQTLSNAQKLKDVKKIWDADKDNNISSTIKNMVEAVLDKNKYKKYKDPKLSSEQIEKINAIIDSHKSYTSLQEVKEVHKQILDIIG